MDQSCSWPSTSQCFEVLLPDGRYFAVQVGLEFLCMTSTPATNKDIFCRQLLLTHKKILAAGFFFLRYKMQSDAELTLGGWNKEARERSCLGKVIQCQMLPTHQV